MLHTIMNQLLTKLGSGMSSVALDAEVDVAIEGDAISAFRSNGLSNADQNAFDAILANLEGDARPGAKPNEALKLDDTVRADIEMHVPNADEETPEIKSSEIIESNPKQQDALEESVAAQKRLVRVSPTDPKTSSEPHTNDSPDNPRWVDKEVGHSEAIGPLKVLHTDQSPAPVKFFLQNPDQEKMNEGHLNTRPSEVEVGPPAQAVRTQFEFGPGQAQRPPIEQKSPAQVQTRIEQEPTQLMPRGARFAKPNTVPEKTTPHGLVIREALQNPVANLVRNNDPAAQPLPSPGFPATTLDMTRHPARTLVRGTSGPIEFDRTHMAHTGTRQATVEHLHKDAPGLTKATTLALQPTMSERRQDMHADKSNPDTPRAKRTLIRDTFVPAVAAQAEKPTVPSGAATSGNFLASPPPQLQSIPEVVFDLPPSFTPLGASESGQATRSTPLSFFQTPDFPRHVAQQVANGVRFHADKTVEITLKPAELGRVQISMSTGEQGVVVHVNAERPETIDLLRRHIDQLASEFQDIGYGQSEFHFGGTGSDAYHDKADNNAPDASRPSDPVNAEPTHKNETDHIAMQNRIDLDRVDIRI